MSCFFNGTRIDGSPLCQGLGTRVVPMMYPDFTNIVMYVTVCEDCLEEWKWHIKDNGWKLENYPVYKLPGNKLLLEVYNLLRYLYPDTDYWDFDIENETELEFEVGELLSRIGDYLNE